MAGRDTAALKTLFKNGDIVHVGNQDAALASVAQATAEAAPSGSSMIDTTGGGASKKETSDKPKVNPASGKTSRCHHISTQKCVHCMSSAVNKEEGKEGTE